MFQESLVESTPLLRTNNRWAVFASVAVQATIITLAITIPLLHPEVLPKQALNHLDFLPSPVRPPAPPPPPQVVRMETASSTTAPAAPTARQALISRTAAEQFTTTAPPADNVIIAMTPSTGHNTSPFSPAFTPAAPAVVPVPSAPPRRPHVSEGVLAGNLLAPIRPEYPAIAKAVGARGIVIIQATISTTGTIENAHVVSGPPLLQQAALAAVCSARYRPYLLNHQPTEVETTFSINFRLGGS